jgi:predicted outer membrane protein
MSGIGLFLKRTALAGAIIPMAAAFSIPAISHAQITSEPKAAARSNGTEPMVSDSPNANVASPNGGAIQPNNFPQRANGAVSQPATSQRAKQITDILARIHQENLNEISHARLAEKRAATPQVKQYARRVIRDRENLDRMVRHAANKLNVDLTSRTAMLDEQPVINQKKQTEKTLLQAYGKNFDHQFLTAQEKVSQNDIDQINNTSSANNSDVKRMLDRAVPVLQRDCNQAKNLLNQNV